jgi:hypothetical protein
MKLSCRHQGLAKIMKTRVSVNGEYFEKEGEFEDSGMYILFVQK